MASTLKQEWIVDGVPTRVLSAGEGPALLFLHGTGGSGKVWFNQLRRFEAAYHVLAPDLPGYGRTPLPETLRSIDDYPAFVQHLMDALGLERAVLIGNSMGGRVALQLALDAPERVAGLVLVNASGLKLPGIPTVNVRETDPAEFASLLFYNPSSRSANPSSRGANPSTTDPGAIAARLTQTPEQRQARETMLRLTAGPLRRDMQDRLGEIQAPTLVIWGEGDRIIPAAYAEAFAAGIPHARLELIPRAGHVPMLEKPGAVNEAIARFLSDLNGGSR